MSPDYFDGPDPVPFADLGNPQSLNLYAYVGNSPLANVDDDGHNPCGAEESGQDAKVEVMSRSRSRPKANGDYLHHPRAAPYSGSLENVASCRSAISCGDTQNLVYHRTLRCHVGPA
jgi:hypothetical protein